MSERKSYRYFDTPEGEDILKKLWVVLKPAGLSAIGISTVDVMAYSKPKGYLNTLARYARISIPIIGASVVFVITTNLAVNIRHKDDKCNWIVGAVAAGSTFGAAVSSIPYGFAATVAFTGLAILKKHSMQNGWILIPENPNTAYSGLHGVKYDWTLTKHRPGNWAVAPPAE